MPPRKAYRCEPAYTPERITGPSNVLGLAVHIAARVAANAQPGEVLLTETVYTLTMGTGPKCEPAGEHQLRAYQGRGASSD
jgi:class 3 adenylate cyclase